MANELTTHRTIGDLAEMISSPALLRLRRISIGTVDWPGQPTKTYLAGGLKLTDEERDTAAKARDRLRGELTSGDDPDTRKQRLGIIAKMLLSYPAANASAESGRARAETYLDALDDVPPWAVSAAVRRWNRGGAGEEHDYRWPPAPAVLRKIAMSELSSLEPVVVHLDRLLAAVSVEEATKQPTAEDRSYVIAGFEKLKADLGAKPQPEPQREAAE